MNSPGLVLYDDVLARTFAPFSLTRPVSALRSGAELVWRRWEWPLGELPTTFVSSPHLSHFREEHAPLPASGVLSPGTIVANARCVVELGAQAGDADVWKSGGDIAAVRLIKPLPVAALEDGSLDLATLAPAGAKTVHIGARWLSAPWDLVTDLSEQLRDDLLALSRRITSVPAKAERAGTEPIVIEAGASIDPFVFLDARGGPIVIREGANIGAFSHIIGPCIIGARAHVIGGRVSGSSIGTHCRIHGDTSASVYIGHVNKAHEGFVGHSVVGRWANLGAGTTTSNLKNSYGPVKMWTPGGDQDTGLTFLGSMIGDHAKLGIGTMLNTGTVVGAGANVFGSALPPKHVPPFAWGDVPPYEMFALDKFLEIAERVMARRGAALDSVQRECLARAHALAGTGEW